MDVQPAVDGKPPLVTLTVPEYSSLTGDLASLAVRICQDSWLFDYYEGKNDGKQPEGLCALPEPVGPVVK